MLNMVILTGHITKSLDLKEINTKNGDNKNVVNGTIAVNDGNSQYADYINFTAWANHANVLCDYTTKGSLVTLTGKWKKKKNKNKEGKFIYYDYLLIENIDLLEDKEKTEKRKAKQEQLNNPFANSDKESIYDTTFNPNIDYK